MVHTGVCSIGRGFKEAKAISYSFFCISLECLYKYYNDAHFFDSLAPLLLWLLCVLEQKLTFAWFTLHIWYSFDMRGRVYLLYKLQSFIKTVGCLAISKNLSVGLS